MMKNLQNESSFALNLTLDVFSLSGRKENNMEDCIFCKIIKGEIPSFKIYEDEKVYG